MSNASTRAGFDFRGAPFEADNVAERLRRHSAKTHLSNVVQGVRGASIVEYLADAVDDVVGLPIRIA